MDVMDGFEAVRHIRNDSSGIIDPQVPIIAMTAFAMTGDKERFMGAGMNDYIAKPVNMKDLMRVIGKLIFDVNEI